MGNRNEQTERTINGVKRAKASYALAATVSLSSIDALHYFALCLIAVAINHVSQRA